MGQTLTNGTYLPAEGERNCYDGLEGNWRSLDGLISTVSGKASASHTHGNITNDGKVGTTANLPLITGTGGAVQAGFFGNQANTFCEGNDSRLSDARTPVAHTHTKSDVTDLLNSNFIPSANNSYDLGSSSYQWNNLYAKNYYYNGVAWGLDKANVWSAENTFTANNINIQRPFTLGDNTYQVARLQILDSASTPQRLGTFNFLHYNNNSSRLEVGIYGLNSNNEIKNRFLLFQLEPNETSSFFPLNNSQINLGTSTNKWKSFNGVNPGALSIFNPLATQDPIDVPNTWVTDGSAWNTLNVSNMGDGWICLTYMLCGANDYILARFGNSSAAYPSMIFPAIMLSTSRYFLYMLVPVAKAMGNIYLEIKLDSNALLVAHCFIPSYGTV